MDTANSLHVSALYDEYNESFFVTVRFLFYRYKHKLTHDVKENDRTTDTLEAEAQSVFQGPVIAAYDGLLVNVKRRTV